MLTKARVCGAGGATSGAKLAGLSVRWGLDKDPHSAATWNANFPTAKHYLMWAHEFIQVPGNLQRFVVDVLHLSPPCQPYS